MNFTSKHKYKTKFFQNICYLLEKHNKPFEIKITVKHQKLHKLFPSPTGRVYVPPKKLRKRREIVEVDNRVVEPNADATGVELHKDSKFYQSWQNFKVRHFSQIPRYSTYKQLIIAG